jgi:cold shock protein
VLNKQIRTTTPDIPVTIVSTCGENRVYTGTVKWFNATKGFGFIQPDSGGEDAFVHISAVERAGMREIVEGQKLSYDLERDKKSGKNSATNLQSV